MLSHKPWHLDSVLRLLLGIFLCNYAGSIVLSALNYSSAKAKTTPLFFFGLAGVALLLLGVTVYLLGKRWTLENFKQRLVLLLGCSYAGLLLGAWAHHLAGSLEARGSVVQMLVATLSFQGAALLLITRLLRRCGTSWTEAFGFSNNWRLAVLLGVTVGCVALPVGLGLQRASLQIMERVSHAPVQPVEQEAVQALRIADSWFDRLALGIITILMVPIAEESLFRGILYPWIKQAGFPRCALWVTSLAFAAVHLNLMIFLPLLALAVGLALLYERTNNLLAPITAHALFNAVNFLMLYITEKNL